MHVFKVDRSGPYKSIHGSSNSLIPVRGAEGLSVTKSMQIAAAFADDGARGKTIKQFAKTKQERDLFRWMLDQFVQ